MNGLACRRSSVNVAFSPFGFLSWRSGGGSLLAALTYPVCSGGLRPFLELLEPRTECLNTTRNFLQFPPLYSLVIPKRSFISINSCPPSYTLLSRRLPLQWSICFHVNTAGQVCFPGRMKEFSLAPLTFFFLREYICLLLFTFDFFLWVSFSSTLKKVGKEVSGRKNSLLPSYGVWLGLRIKLP